MKSIVTTIVTLFAVMVMGLSGCDNELNLDSHPPRLEDGFFSGSFRIRFIDENGKNWLDKLIEDGVDWKTRFHYAYDFHATVVSGRGATLGVGDRRFYDSNEGSYLCFPFHRSPTKSPQGKETYTMEISSDRWLEAGEKHTAKWYVERKGNYHDCYRCEVDGKEVPVTEGYTYPDGRFGRYATTPIITVHLKKGAK